MDWNTQLQVIGEVALAMLLGGVIGIEREVANKPAGFRTHMLVAGAAALLVGLGDALLQRFGAGTDASIRSDPIRIVEAIITGISFLGAGTIFRRGKSEHVEGLTTAASILLSSAIGISVALRQMVLAVGATALALITLYALRFVEKYIERKRAPESRS
ncbi:MAG TPA: MgtC/SapB family protein [Blastocatellia bacterium]|nr:MgtC/SapB family protein [Blastocatellia bacterium]